MISSGIITLLPGLITRLEGEKRSNPALPFVERRGFTALGESFLKNTFMLLVLGLVSGSVVMVMMGVGKSTTFKGLEMFWVNIL